MNSIKDLFSHKSFTLIFVLFTILLVWRIILLFSSAPNLDIQIQVWAASYQIVAWAGAIIGLALSKRWGGYKSIVGRAAIAFSLGLLAQSFGQSVFSYYFYTGNELPYPSLADVGFFGSIPFYIYGISLLAKVSGVRFSLTNVTGKLSAIVIPAIILGVSYLVFLRGYQFDVTHPVRIMLDFGYPLGQAIYISIAILAYILSRNFLGGMMRGTILFFIFALAAQYVSDYTFLFQSMRGSFVGGGIVDVMYFVSYVIMSISLIELGLVFHRIRNSA